MNSLPVPHTVGWWLLKGRKSETEPLKCLWWDGEQWLNEDGSPYSLLTELDWADAQFFTDAGDPTADEKTIPEG